MTPSHPHNYQLTTHNWELRTTPSSEMNTFFILWQHKSRIEPGADCPVPVLLGTSNYPKNSRSEVRWGNHSHTPPWVHHTPRKVRKKEKAIKMRSRWLTSDPALWGCEVGNIKLGDTATLPTNWPYITSWEDRGLHSTNKAQPERSYGEKDIIKNNILPTLSPCMRSGLLRAWIRLWALIHDEESTWIWRW